MEIIFWRHAEAEEAGHGSVTDTARALTKRGHKQAKAMAAWLAERLPKDCRVIVSPAVRTQQTAAALDRAFDTSIALGLGATPKGVLAEAGWPQGKGGKSGQGIVLVVGHQPTLGSAAALALWDHDEDWDLKKGAIVWIAEKDGGRDRVLRAALTPDLV